MRAWPIVKLSEVAKIDRAGISASDIQGGTRYVGLEHIESGGRILETPFVQNGDLASNKFQFGPNHILYGKLRPYLAKIARPDFNGICSTDILPILTSSKIDRDYLTQFLRQPSMVEYARSRSEGANLPRLSPKALAAFEVPLPPLQEQKRIAVILDHADTLRRLRRLAVDRLNQLSQAIFFEMFGAKSNIKKVELDSMADLKRGPFGGSLKKEIFVESGFKIYEQSNAIKKNANIGRYYIDRNKYTEMRDFALQSGDLIVSCSGTLGRVYLIPDEAPEGIINQALLRIRAQTDKVLPEYLECFLESFEMQNFLNGFSRGTGLQNFPPMAEVRKIMIPLPSMAEQRNLLDRFNILSECKDQSVRNLAYLENLVTSLQYRAFRGEL